MSIPAVVGKVVIGVLVAKTVIVTAGVGSILIYGYLSDKKDR